MNPRIFTTKVENIHRQLLSRNLCLNGIHSWIDLHNNDLYFELKCRLHGLRKDGSASWACNNEQIQKYCDNIHDTNRFWIFLIYKLDRPVTSLKIHIKPYITHREVWILPWNFIYKFPVYQNAYCSYRYPKQSQFPKSLKTMVIDNTNFHYSSTRIHDLLTNAMEVPF